MDASSIRTFLAANTPNGFKSVFEPFLEGKTTYIIKGGPGTGKSGLMKKIAAEAVRRGEFAELIHCSSDPESLDGVYIPSRNVAICDGTAPHTLDPKYPGAAGGIIDLGRFWDLRALTANRSGIVSLSEQISARYAEAYRYLGAGGLCGHGCKRVYKAVCEHGEAGRVHTPLYKEAHTAQSGRARQNVQEVFVRVFTLGIHYVYGHYRRFGRACDGSARQISHIRPAYTPAVRGRSPRGLRRIRVPRPAHARQNSPYSHTRAVYGRMARSNRARRRPNRLRA